MEGAGLGMLLCPVLSLLATLLCLADEVLALTVDDEDDATPF